MKWPFWPLFAVITLLTTSCCANGVNEAEELETWNRELQNQNWRALLASSGQPTLGLFLSVPTATELSATETSLTQCGVNLVSRTRRQFTSPPVPSRIQISTEGSRALARSFEPFFSNGAVERIMIRITNPQWIRLLPSETTGLIHASAIWSNPATRGPIVKCVSDHLAHPLTDSILKADVIISAEGNHHRTVDVDNIVRAAPKESMLAGALISKGHTYSVSDVTLARRTGICVNSVLFFHNSSGDVGVESCPTPASTP
jgi:hypothetical protein